MSDTTTPAGLEIPKVLDHGEVLRAFDGGQGAVDLAEQYAAEAESLRAAVERVRELGESRMETRPNDVLQRTLMPHNVLAALDGGDGLTPYMRRADDLRAAVGRVRDVCTEESYNDANGDLVIRAADVLRALDGQA